jgi:hypothetical protein
MTGQAMIQEALNERSRLNTNHTWATFEAINFLVYTICTVKWGWIHSNGMKEAPLQTIVWKLYSDGKCEKARLNHV